MTEADNPNAADPGAARSRARAWRDACHAAICDSIEPWAHGTVVRASSYPRYYDFNVVRVEDEPGLDVDALASFADDALAGLDHRRLDFDCLSAAEQRRGGFEAMGWRATRLLWMRHERPAPRTDVAVEVAPYDVAQPLRELWHMDFNDHSPKEYHRQAREVALRRGAETLVIRDRGGSPIAFAQLEREAAEITEVYVHPDHRGRGLGTALTLSAIERAGEVRELWITADDEERAKDLYARLGFVPVWTSMNFLRVLDDGSGAG
ncbi:MAG: GNAT family N-acetyltransferase [Solirubrobacteraceae bacterium]